MKDRYRLIRRSNRYYAVDRNTQARESLGTDSLRVAKRLLVAKNEAAQQTNLNLLIGRTYLGANDPNMVLRTWQLVMDECCKNSRIAFPYVPVASQLSMPSGGMSIPCARPS